MKCNAKTSIVLIAIIMATFSISRADFPTYSDEYQDPNWDEAGYGLTSHFINGDEFIDLVTTNEDPWIGGISWYNDDEDPGILLRGQAIAGGREAKFGFLTYNEAWNLAIAGGTYLEVYKVGSPPNELRWEQRILADYPVDFLCWGHVDGDEYGYGDVVATGDGSTQWVFIYVGYYSGGNWRLSYDPVPFGCQCDPEQLALVGMYDYHDPIYGMRWSLLAVDGGNSNYIKLFHNSIYGQVYFTADGMQTIDAEDPIGDFALADINDDGYDDLVLCTNNTTTEDYYVRIYMNNGEGAFNTETAPHPQAFDDFIDQVALADLGCYGLPSLVVYYGGGTVQIYPNHSGAIDFNDPAAPIHVPQNSDWIQANELLFVDLAGNGMYSLAMTGIEDETDPGLWIWYNDGPSPYIHPVHHLAVDGIQGGHPTVLWGESEDFDVNKYVIYRALMADTSRPTENDFDSLTCVSYPTTQFTDTTVLIHTEEDNYKIWYTVTAMDYDDNESIKLQYVTFWGYYGEDGQAHRFYESVAYIQPDEFGVSISPNPFNPITRFSFSLPEAAHVTLQVFDLQGRLVATLVDGLRGAGAHEATFDASHLASGLYLYHLTAGTFRAGGKMVLVK